jgi:hypothetical protein
MFLLNEIDALPLESAHGTQIGMINLLNTSRERGMNHGRNGSSAGGT